jgi:protein subunit release factor A
MKKRKLLFSVTKKDLEIQTFRAGGKGGQNQNKRDTGVRIIHRESGAVGEARDQRTQGQNRRNAFKRLVASPKFKKWHRIKTAQMMGVHLAAEDWADEQMKNIQIEVKENGKWKVV